MAEAALPKVVDPLLDTEQRELMARFAIEMAPSTTRVHVRPMARFGFSGAKLCVVHFDDARLGRPFVVKIDALDDYNVERKAIADLLVYFADADVHYYSHGSYGAIAYPMQQSATGTIETFEDVLKSSTKDEARLKGALERVYAKCCVLAHSASSVEPRNLGTEYLRYHQSAVTDKALSTALGPTYNDAPFDFNGQSIVDPRAVKDRLTSADRDIVVGPVHGDLHGSNIVFDPDNYPHLIDFAWGDRAGHLMKDFVLMENSLRFFAFSRYFDSELQAAVDAALLEESGPQIMSALAKDSPLKDDYKCLASLIEVTRNAARTRAGPGFFDEYLMAQFMILYRLVQYPTYPFHSTLRALGALGKRILVSI